MPLPVKERAETAYTRVAPMLHSVTHKMAKRFGVHHDELIGVTHEIFMEAHRKYDPKRGTAYTTWVYSRVQWRLISFIRTQGKHIYLDKVEFEELHGGHTEHNSFITVAKSELSRDARTVLRYVLDAPRDLSSRMHRRGVHTPTQVRTVLTLYLRSRGWSEQRIDSAYEEIIWMLERR